MKRRAFLISAAATLAGLSVPVFSTVLGKCSLRGAFPDRELTVDTTEGPARRSLYRDPVREDAGRGEALESAGTARGARPRALPREPRPQGNLGDASYAFHLAA